MKKYVLLPIGLLFSALWFSSFENGITSFGLNRTGSTGGLATCGDSVTHCHSTTSTAVPILSVILMDGAQVVSNGIYHPGRTYRIEVKGGISSSSSLYPVYGFQFTAGTVNDGSFTLIGNDLKSTFINTIQFIEHKQPIAPVGNNYQSYFYWTAPPPGAGTINFYCTMLIGNGDHAVTGDHSKNVIVSFQEGAPTGVADLDNSVEVNIHPSPAVDFANITIATDKPGDYSIRVFDLSGKEVHKESLQVGTEKKNVRLNTAAWQSGLYFVEVESSQGRRLMKIVKQ
ncbi:MAG TPA: choice-of-anchor V domain-containing protein [Flavipsychrobacter sp.]|nr:choice-of-anchor V domain-containing protein [Flavipsychrobacter sp.]